MMMSQGVTKNKMNTASSFERCRKCSNSSKDFQSTWHTVKQLNDTAVLNTSSQSYGRSSQVAFNKTSVNGDALEAV